MTGDPEAAAEIVPECDAELAAGLGKSEERIATIAATVAACSGADLAAGNPASDVVLGTIGIQRCLGSVEHHQQLSFIGVQARQEAIKCDEASASAKDAIESRAQCEAAVFLGRVR